MIEVRATANIDDVLRRVLRAHAPLLVIAACILGRVFCSPEYTSKPG